MYTVTYDGQTLYSPLMRETAVTQCECDIIVNEAGSLTVSIPPGHPFHGDITLYDTSKEVRLYDDGVEIFRAIPISCETDMNGIETITCKGQLGILNNTVVRAYGTYPSENGEWPSWRIAPRQANAYFEWLLANHNNRANLRDRFTVVHNGLGASELTRSSTVWPTVAQEMLDKVLSPLGAYLMAGTAEDGSRTLEVRYEGEYSTQPVEFGSNLLDYAQMRDYSEVATCIVPTGTKEDGTTFDLNGWTPEGLPSGIIFYQDRVYDEVEMLRYGVIEHHVNYEAESQTALAHMAANQIRRSLLSPIESISISAVDLSKAGRHDDRLMAGKSVHIVSRPHGVDQWMMCTETRLDILDPSRDEYILGAVTRSYTSISAGDARAALRDASGISPAVSNAIATKSTVEVSQSLTSGVAVGTVTVNGTPTVLYAPQGGGGAETDPVFTASPAHSITNANISSWNAKGTYSKPSGGIPKSDLASAVQTSLGKADTSVQSVTVTPSLTSGTEVGSINVDGNTTTLYAPAGGGGYPGADYPLEVVYGTEPTDWSYVKWANGRLECWVDVGFGWAGAHGVTKVGNVYKSTYEIGTGLTYPVAFAVTPNVQAFVDPSGNYPGRVEPGGTKATTTKPGGYKVVRDVTGNINGYICIKAEGRWK